MMTEEAQPTTRLQRYAELLAKKKAAKDNMLDERYPDVTEFTETEEDRHVRIWNTPSAWNKLG